MLVHAGKEHEVKPVNEAPAGCGFAPPMCTFPEGHSIGQTNVLTSEVGKACGLAPEGDAANMKAQQLVADAGDLLTELDKPAERVNKWLAYVESTLSGSYFLGDAGTYVDFGYYCVFDVIALKKAAGKLEDVVVPDKLEAWYQNMAEVKGVAELKARDIPMLPENFL